MQAIFFPICQICGLHLKRYVTPGLIGIWQVNIFIQKAIPLIFVAYSLGGIIVKDVSVRTGPALLKSLDRL